MSELQDRGGQEVAGVARVEGPIVVVEGAGSVGYDEVAEIIDNGSDAPGTLLERCSAAFRQRFETAALIIAKGQANYESLSDSRAPLFFLLQTKCDVIGRELGVPTGSLIVKGPRAE